MRLSKAWVRVAAACVVATVGVVAAWRALGPISLERRNPAATSAAVSRGPVNGSSRPVIRVVCDDPVDASNLEVVTSEIVSRLRENTSDEPGLTSRQRNALFAEIESVLPAYLGGESERYFEYARIKGGRLKGVSMMSADAEALERWKGGWDFILDAWAQHPISIEDVRLRPRYIAGSEQPTAIDMDQSQRLFAEDRYPIPRDPQAAALTIYEVLVPAMYRWRESEGPAWYGIWLAWSAEHNEWFIWQIQTYDPERTGVSLCPPY